MPSFSNGQKCPFILALAIVILAAKIRISNCEKIPDDSKISGTKVQEKSEFSLSSYIERIREVQGLLASSDYEKNIPPILDGMWTKLLFLQKATIEFLSANIFFR